MKLLITASLGYIPVANNFYKPLNPIIGETFEASYMDGTKMYIYSRYSLGIQNR